VPAAAAREEGGSLQRPTKPNALHVTANERSQPGSAVSRPATPACQPEKNVMGMSGKCGVNNSGPGLGIERNCPF
jgi:hypothetical protein